MNLFFLDRLLDTVAAGTSMPMVRATSRASANCNEVQKLCARNLFGRAGRASAGLAQSIAQIDSCPNECSAPVTFTEAVFGAIKMTQCLSYQMRSNLDQMFA